MADRNMSRVAENLGWYPQRISQMVGRAELPNVIDAVRLCGYLGVSVESIFGDESGAKVARPRPAKAARDLLAMAVSLGPWRGAASMRALGRTRIIEREDYRGEAGFVPLLAPIAAGEPREAHDQGFPVGAAEAFVQFACDDPQAFALTVDGDSMAPDFRHGDLVVARPTTGRKRPGLADGMAAVVIFEGERVATLKIARFGAVNKTTHEPMDYKLEPLNAAFPALRLKTREIAAIYPVVGLVRRE